MSIAARRRLRLVVMAAGLLPTLVALALVRPLPARGASAIGFYAVTYSGAAIAPQGEIGAGGGLLPLDGGAPLVRGRVESAPSSSSVAASVEPGTLWSTVAGVANTEAGQEVIPTPTRAEAMYPGRPDASANQFGPAEAGPLSVGLGTALASAKDGLATGRAELATWRVAGQAQASARTLGIRLAQLRARYPAAPRAQAAAEDDGAAIAVDAGRAFGEAKVLAADGVITVRAQSSVQDVRVAGELTVHGLAGHAEAGVSGGRRTAKAGLTIAGAVLGDFPVQITTSGVALADQSLPADQAAALSAQLNEALAAAGVQVALLPPVEQTGDGSADADSGGLVISLRTPSDGGIPGNTFGVVVGRVAVTSADEPTTPGAGSGDEPIFTDPAAGGLSGGFTGSAPLTGTLTGPLDTGASVGIPPATVGEAAAAPGSVVLAGRAIPASVALSAFAVWQLLSLSTSTLAALALRDREAAA